MSIAFKQLIHKLGSVGIEQPKNCVDPINYNGSRGVFVFEIELGTDQGVVDFDYNALGIPDRFQLEYDSVIVADSLYVGSNLTGNPPDLPGGFVGNTYNGVPEYSWNGVQFILNGNTQNLTITQPDVAAFGATGATGTLSFVKGSASPTTMTVRVFAPLVGTAWNATPYCPVPTAPASIAQDDFQEQGEGGCTSCATVTVTVPVGTNKRVEFVKTGDGGQYSVGLGLCAGGNDVASDLVEVISATKTYRFGIDATKVNPNAFSNTITVTVYDDDTDAFEDQYTHIRTHGNVNC